MAAIRTVLVLRARTDDVLARRASRGEVAVAELIPDELVAATNRSYRGEISTAEEVLLDLPQTLAEVVSSG